MYAYHLETPCDWSKSRHMTSQLKLHQSMMRIKIIQPRSLPGTILSSKLHCLFQVCQLYKLQILMRSTVGIWDLADVQGCASQTCVLVQENVLRTWFVLVLVVTAFLRMIVVLLWVISVEPRVEPMAVVVQIRSAWVIPCVAVMDVVVAIKMMRCFNMIYIKFPLIFYFLYVPCDN